jgi:hypothetical protein
MKQDINIIRQVNELKSKIFYSRLYSAFESTICFFRNDDKEVVAPAGSGVFLKYKDSYYVVTAAHVLAEFYNDTFVILEDKELTIGGRIHSSPMPPSQTRDDDKIDISVLKTDDQSSKELLTRFKPIDISEIELNHQLSNTATYFSVGFPLTRTEKIWGKNEIKSIGYTYQSEPIIDYNFQQFGFSYETTIAIKFDRGVTSASIPTEHRSPDLTGVSGSGLWHFYDKNKKTLIGIAIEQIKETGHKAMLATKIDVVIKMINEME